MKNVYIRGIYSTALTNIFLNAGFNVIFPSKLIRKRFYLESEKKDLVKEISIQDRWDKQGINLKFSLFNNPIENPKIILDSIPINQKSFPDLLVLNSQYPRNSIYVGTVIRSYKDKGYSIVDLASEKENEKSSNALISNEYWPDYGIVNRYYDKNFKGVFQVSQEDSGKKAPILQPHYSLSGNYLVILPKSKVKVLYSKKIQSTEVRTNLLEISKSFNLRDAGIIFRTASQFTSEENLLEELKTLKELRDFIDKEIIEAEDNRQIYQDTFSTDYLFPESIKIKMDEERRKICKTIQYHHSLKSIISQETQGFEMFLDFNEYLLENLKEEETVINSSINEFILDKFFQIDQVISIAHQKLLGKVEYLSPGTIIEIFKKPQFGLKVKRKFRAKGRYDGLDLPIEKDDYALVHFKQGEWSYKNEYYDKNNNFKGAYHNLNTPISIRPLEIHYFDLEIDVVEFEDGTKKVIDQELFEMLHKNQIISQKTYERVNLEVSNILNQ